MPIIPQLAALQEMNEVKAEAERALQGFRNSFDSALARINNFDTNILPASGLDAGDLATVGATRQGIITQSITEMQTRLTQLQAL